MFFIQLLKIFDNNFKHYEDYTIWLVVVTLTMLLAVLAGAIYLMKVRINKTITAIDWKNILEILEDEDKESIDFFPSISISQQTGYYSFELIIAWLKSWIAFGNAEGGYIVFGLNSVTDVHGIDKKEGTEMAELLNTIQQTIKKYVGPGVKNYHALSSQISGKRILVLQIIPSQKALYLKIDKNKQFYTRFNGISVEVKEDFIK
jgi:predicted HTH transcriptional regulator